MKIAVWHNLPSGGGKRALFYHVRGLRERGHVLESWCPSSADQAYLPLGELITEHVDHVAIREIGWPRLRYHELGVAVTIRRRLKAMLEHSHRCARQMDQGGFDVLFANSCVFFGSPQIARHTRLPSVLYLQEPYRRLYEAQHEAQPRLPWPTLSPDRYTSRYSPRFIRHWLADWISLPMMRIQAREELRNARAFTSILVNSLYSRESVLRAYGIDTCPCYLGVDTERFVDRHERRDAFVVGVGSFTRNKNIEFVIAAVARLKSDPRRLVWIGNVADGAYVEELRSLASRLDVVLEVKLHASDAEIVDLLNRAAVMAYAPRLEPFGFAPLEANACGLAVVGVAEAGVRETIVDRVNGLLCEPDPQAMADAIQRLLDNPAYAKELGASGRAIVESRWSLEAATDRVESRLREAATHTDRK
jgi:glycosyltransferase involved in cell wall biosynthesis